jgi:hypothetical protein
VLTTLPTVPHRAPVALLIRRIGQGRPRLRTMVPSALASWWLPIADSVRRECRVYRPHPAEGVAERERIPKGQHSAGPGRDQPRGGKW